MTKDIEAIIFEGEECFHIPFKVDGEVVPGKGVFLRRAGKWMEPAGSMSLRWISARASKDTGWVSGSPAVFRSMMQMIAKGLIEYGDDDA